MGQAPATNKISLRTVPRNFPGRSGTKEDKVYLCSPEVAAAISNYVAFANTNRAATPLLDEAIRKDPGIYPPPEVMAKLNSAQVLPATAQRLRVRAWTRVKSGR